MVTITADRNNLMHVIKYYIYNQPPHQQHIHSFEDGAGVNTHINSQFKRQVHVLTNNNNITNLQ